MTDGVSLLIEVGCEELPPALQQPMAQALGQYVHQQLQKRQLGGGQLRCFAAARRIGFHLSHVAYRQADQTQWRYGPFVTQSLNEQGQPLPAVLGFARKMGVDWQQLQRKPDAKGERFAHQHHQVGAATLDILPALLNDALTRLPVKKTMRWGEQSQRFVRPVRWLLALLGDEVVPWQAFDLSADRYSGNHRFASPATIRLASADHYPQALIPMVIADFNHRRQHIQQQLEQLAQQHNVNILIEPDLLDEVTGLTEAPRALLGEFDHEFLTLPREVLTATLQKTQKCFAVEDQSGKVRNQFITIVDTPSQQEALIIHGNQRVVTARLCDARYFWQTDSQQPLHQRIDALEKVTYQQGLGSLYDKAQRLATLSVALADRLHLSAPDASRAAWLSKCDLTTLMVQEYPELQGIMGGHYSRYDGENESVAWAVTEHYQPTGASDQLPQRTLSCTLALADRLDSLVGLSGCFGLPSADKDPYSLRRHALATLRLLIENQWPLDLAYWLERSAQQYPKLPKFQLDNLVEFVMLRAKHYYRQVPTDIFQAVQALAITQPLAMDQRLQALQDPSHQQALLAMAASYKRLHNLLKKQEAISGHLSLDNKVDEPAEQALRAALANGIDHYQHWQQQGNYGQIINNLAQLQPLVDQFFEQVMVLVEDNRVRQRRLHLLQTLRQQYDRVANLSLLTIEPSNH